MSRLKAKAIPLPPPPSEPVPASCPHCAAPATIWPPTEHYPFRTLKCSRCDQPNLLRFLSPTGIPPLTFRGELPPSPTYSVRWWLWKPTPEGPYAGELTITQVGRSKTDIAVYLVEVVPFEGRGTLRAFLLANQTNGEVYAVELNGVRGDNCTCKSSQCRKQCKHPPTLRAMVARGLI